MAKSIVASSATRVPAPVKGKKTPRELKSWLKKANQRWLISSAWAGGDIFTPQIQPVPADSLVIRYADLPKHILNPESRIPTDVMLEIINACMTWVNLSIAAGSLVEIDDMRGAA